MSCCPQSGSVGSDFQPMLFDPSTTAILPARVFLPEGIGFVGTSKPCIPSDGEGQIRRGKITPLYMSSGTITNAEFAAFVRETGYITEAEHLGWSFVFWKQVPDYVGDTQGVPSLPWWRRVGGASWQRITGPQCSLVHEQADHPVVHISWNDARAYCSWIGGRLPTELEWEYAARGGLGDVRFPWGDIEPDDDQNLLCNIWQGRFPHENTAKDGYFTTAPAVSFEPNNYGLYNLMGNVWEWTADPFRQLPRHPPRSRNADSQPEPAEVLKLSKGGSFLCHKSYCYRYRIAARISNPVDNSTTHMGFRVVWDLDA